MSAALIPARSLLGDSGARTRQASGAMNSCMGAVSYWQAELSTRGAFHAKNRATPYPALKAYSPSLMDSYPCTLRRRAVLLETRFSLLMRIPFYTAFQRAHSM